MMSAEGPRKPSCVRKETSAQNEEVLTEVRLAGKASVVAAPEKTGKIL